MCVRAQACACLFPYDKRPDLEEEERCRGAGLLASRETKALAFSHESGGCAWRSNKFHFQRWPSGQEACSFVTIISARGEPCL